MSVHEDERFLNAYFATVQHKFTVLANRRLLSLKVTSVWAVLQISLHYWQKTARNFFNGTARFFHIHIYRCGLSPCPHTVSGGCLKTSDGVATVKGSRKTLWWGLGRTSSSGPDAAALPWVWREGLWIGGSGRVWLKCPGTNWSLVDCHQVLSSGQFDKKSWSILTAGDWYFSH